jgi:tyrosine-protein phosphatase OCA6
MTSAPTLNAPFRFAAVEDGLYRGAYPTLKNLRFLRRLRLKTIVSVIPELPTSDLRQFCDEEKINILHFQADRFKGEPTTSQQTVAQILQTLIEPAAHPCYVHCLDGTNVSGLVIMCLRKLQHWATASTLSEFVRYV